MPVPAVIVIKCMCVDLTRFNSYNSILSAAVCLNALVCEGMQMIWYDELSPPLPPLYPREVDAVTWLQSSSSYDCQHCASPVAAAALAILMVQIRAK